MSKMGYPKGLISYTTEHTLEGRPAKVFRPKLIGYFMVLVVVCAAFVVNLSLRKPLEMDIIRDRGALYRETPEGLIENTYTLNIINKSQQEKTYSLRVNGIENLNWMGPETVTLAGGETRSVVISLSLDPYYASKPVLDLAFTVSDVAAPDISISQGNKFFAGR